MHFFLIGRLVHSHSLLSILCPAVRVTSENANLITSLVCLKSLVAAHASQEKVQGSQHVHKSPQAVRPSPHPILHPWLLSTLQCASSLLPQGFCTYCSFPLLLPQLHWRCLPSPYQAVKVSFPSRNIPRMPYHLPSCHLLLLSNIYHNHD